MAQFPSTTAADGIWTLKKVRRAILGDNWPPLVYPDEFFANTVLLLNGDGANGAQNNTFLDSSTNDHTITRNGNVTQGSFSPFAKADGKWGNYFNGSSGYIYSADYADYNFGTGDFTVECWFWADRTANTQGLIGFRPDTSNGSYLTLQFTSGNQIGLYNQTAGGFMITTSAINKSEWYHLAVCRDSGTTTMYLNGVSQGSFSDSTNYITGANRPRIGGNDYFASPTGDAVWDGYISNVRIVKGTAVYTSAFTPPTEPLTNITNTELLTCQSNRFVDNSTNDHSITVNGDVEVTTFSPFAETTAYTPATKGGSGYFDGTGDYLNSSASMTIPTNGDFTIECWVYATTQTNQGVIQLSTTNSIADFDIFISMYPNLEFQWGYSSGNNYVSTTGSKFPIRTWLHVAMVRNSGTTKLYINGVDSGGTVSSTTAYTITNMFVGSYYSTSNLFNGYISDARVINGTALYTSNFTPPTAPLTPTSGTSLLCNFTNASIIDATGRNVIETVGNAQVDTTTFKYGTGAMEFDGVSDYIDIPASPLFDFGTGDWTMECWFNTTSTTTDTFFRRMIMLDGPTGNATNNPQLTISSDGYVNGWTQTGDVDLRSSTGFNDGNWHHAAFVRDGGTLRLFVDGVQSATVATTATFSPNSGSPRPRIGNYNGSTGQGDWDGYIDDLRITKGIARYTANFTPPTAELPVIGEV